MADKNTSITPTHEGRYLGTSRQFGWNVSPFRALQRMVDDVDRVFDDFRFGRRWAGPSWRQGAAEAWAPDVEVFHKGDELKIRADLPGLKKDEISVDLTDDAITIQGERRREHEEEREGVYRSERTYGSFYRMIPLPEGAITEQAKANFRDGVLEITMPAPPTAKGRRLEISEGATKK